MVTYGFDVSEITKDLFKTKDFETTKEIKKFLNKHGMKSQRTILKIAKKKVKKVTGYYFESIKKGKVYQKNGVWNVRVYTNAPHSHLIEDGHDIVRGGKKGKGGKVIGRAKGKKVMAKFENDYAKTFYKSCEDLADELLEKGFTW